MVNIPASTIEINHSCRQIYVYICTIHWACGLDISKIMTYEKSQRFGQTQLAARKMFITTPYDIRLQNHQTQTHQYHQWSSPWFSWFKSYPIYVHQKTALLFLARERVRIPFLVLQSLFYEVFLDHGLPKKKNQLSLIWVMYFRTSLGLGSSIKLLMKRNLAHQWILEDDTLFYFS